MLTSDLKLRLEEQFIINCLRSEYGGESHDEFANFDFRNIDWNLVHRRAMQWEVAPLLSKIIKKRSSLSQFSNIPGHFLEKIKIAYLSVFIRNETAIKKLVELLEVFNSAGIKVILLKGTHLAQFVYRDIGLRPMKDVDILVKKEDLYSAAELLLQMGYQFRQKYQDTHKQTDVIHCDKTHPFHLTPFSHPKGIKHLEVHWTITDQNNPFNIHVESFWGRAEKAVMNGSEVLVFCPEDLLLYLSLHTSHQHKLEVGGLKPYCDISAVINYYDVNWSQLLLGSFECRAKKFVYLTLRFSREILGANVPDRFLNDVKPNSFNEKLVLEARQRVFSSEIKKIAPREEIFDSGSGLLKRLSFIFHRTFVSPKDLAVHYSLPISSKRVYFYYIVRFISLLYHHTPIYMSLLLKLLIRKKAHVYNNNLDLWLTSSDSEINNSALQSEIEHH